MSGQRTVYFRFTFETGGSSAAPNPALTSTSMIHRPASKLLVKLLIDHASLSPRDINLRTSLKYVCTRTDSCTAEGEMPLQTWFCFFWAAFFPAPCCFFGGMAALPPSFLDCVLKVGSPWRCSETGLAGLLCT